MTKYRTKFVEAADVTKLTAIVNKLETEGWEFVDFKLAMGVGDAGDGDPPTWIVAALRREEKEGLADMGGSKGVQMLGSIT